MKAPSGDFGFAVRIPVFRSGELIYVLSAVIPLSLLQDLLASEARVEDEWVKVIVDDRGLVLARSREPEKFVGMHSTPSFFRQVTSTDEGSHFQRSLENKPVYLI